MVNTHLKCHSVERYSLHGLYARADNSSTPRDESRLAPLNMQNGNGDNNWLSEVVLGFVFRWKIVAALIQRTPLLLEIHFQLSAMLGNVSRPKIRKDHLEHAGNNEGLIWSTGGNANVKAHLASRVNLDYYCLDFNAALLMLSGDPPPVHCSKFHRRTLVGRCRTTVHWQVVGAAE